MSAPVQRRFPPALLVALAAATFPAAAPAADGSVVGPGRVVLPTTATAPEPNVDAGGASTGLALPDGGAVLVGADRGRGLVLARVTASGALDPSFGTGGISRVALGPATPQPLQLLRRPDGRLLVVVSPTGAVERVQLVGLTPAGFRDAAFGTAGIAEPGLRSSCAVCAPAALQADGSVVVVGDRLAGTATQGAAVRLDPAGAVDPAFGSGGVAAVAGAGGAGASATDVVARPDGRLVVLGQGPQGTVLAGLDPSGAADGAFAGGGPVSLGDLRAHQLLLTSDGAVAVLGATVIARVTAAGAPDRGFGAGGTTPLAVGGPFLPLGHLLEAPDGALLVTRPGGYEPHLPGDPSLVVGRVTRAGVSQAVGSPSLGFGGGYASSAGSTRLVLGGVAQDSFRLGRLLARPGGGYLAVGGTRIIRYTGEGEGFSRGFFAVAGLTPGLLPDPSVGGPLRPATARVKVLPQRARLDARAGRIRVRVRATAPGLVLLRVRDRAGRVLGQVVAPLYDRGTTVVRVPLTAPGRRLLARGRRTRVVVGHELRDVVGGTSAGSTPGTLR